MCLGTGGGGDRGGGVWGVPPSCRRCGVGPAASSAEAGKGKVLNSPRSRARKRGGGFGTAGTCRAHPNRERRGQVCGDGTERGGGGAERGPRERSQERQECGSARTGLKTEAADAGRRRGEGEAGGSRVGTERTPHRAAEPKAVGNAGQRDGWAPCVLRSLGGPPPRPNSRPPGTPRIGPDSRSSAALSPAPQPQLRRSVPEAALLALGRSRSFFPPTRRSGVPSAAATAAGRVGRVGRAVNGAGGAGGGCGCAARSTGVVLRVEQSEEQRVEQCLEQRGEQREEQ